MIEDYILLTQKMVFVYGKRFLNHYTFSELLSFGYEGLIRAYRSYNKSNFHGDIEGWISLKIKKALVEGVRKGDLANRSHREKINNGEAPPIKLLDLDEVVLSVNGYEIQRMVDRQYLEYLMVEARLKPKCKRRLQLYYFYELTLAEIADIEDVSESAVCGSNMRSIRRMQRVLD